MAFEMGTSENKDFVRYVKKTDHETLLSCDRQSTLLNRRIFEGIKFFSVHLFSDRTFSAR